MGSTPVVASATLVTEVDEQAFAFQCGKNLPLLLAKAQDWVEHVAAEQS